MKDITLYAFSIDRDCAFLYTFGENSRLCKELNGRTYRLAPAAPVTGARSAKARLAWDPHIEGDPVMLKEHEYIRQTLERYTNCSLEEFCDHILITNFRQYIQAFHERTQGSFLEGNFRIVNAKDRNCTMIDFGIGSPQAALLINCLAYLDNLKSVIMVGMCGGIDDILEVGDFVVPSAAIRGEGTSRHYLPREFPSIPASSVNLFCIGAVRHAGVIPRCGIVYTTDRRLWEFDEEFVAYLRRQRILAIEMELATLFSVAYRFEVPIGSVMLVSDMPLQRRGIKSKKLHEEIYSKYMETHLDIAEDAVKRLSAKWEEVERKLASEW